MSDIAISVDNVSKMYRLGVIGTGTLSHDLNRWWHKVRGKEDPYMMLGAENVRDSAGSNYVWALQDISFDVRGGEVLGIIGKNGAGKSTLLKLLSRVTAPTKGTIRARGRIASLLEVGTGFHPELTGRENIFLNGAILGMTKSEIRSKFDEIVDFSGVERYVDTPVKRYSSGMYVRLAFAVAAFLEPEILIVDEVLAVGDADFQKKCIGRMKDVSENLGRTVLFVSHNMSAVKQLCTRGIVLKNGKYAFEGNALEAVNYYQSSHNTNSSFEHKGSLDKAPGNDNIRILKFEVKPLKREVLSVNSGLEFELQFYHGKQNTNFDVTFDVKNMDEIVVFHNGIIVSPENDSKQGIYTIRGKLDSGMLNAGSYKLMLIFAENQRTVLYKVQDFIQFEVLNETIGNNTGIIPGVFRPEMEYTATFETNVYEPAKS